ncbi:MAG: hypothetical protein QMD85_01310 [Candidatus Aenigmarchaeota archaeon]|nr:hypothetical protein [Candidatus Aenigmarchaeota archaeon]MDI6722190.1 hypothetical protein [Candidatus Aenigmarchaeota archaeon]
MKGISPLVASVLLLAIVVSIAVVVGSWVSGMAKDTTATVGNRTAESVSCSASDIIVEALYVHAGNEATGYSRAVIRNQGFQALTLTSAQLINRTGFNVTTSSTLGIIAKGEAQVIVFPNTSVSVCPTDYSRLILTSNCGGVSHIFTGAPICS